MDAIEVRPAREADLDDVLAVGHETWPPTYGPLAGEEYVREGLSRWWTPASTLPAVLEGRVLVAAEGPEVLAMAMWSASDGVATLWKLYVRPAHQGRGLGGRLLDAVVAAVTPSAGVLRLSHMDGNDRAHAVYSARGFTETGREPDELADGPDSIWMELPLPGG